MTIPREHLYSPATGQVDVLDPYDLRLWSLVMAAPEDDVRAAAEVVGKDAYAVFAYLAERKKGLGT